MAAPRDRRATTSGAPLRSEASTRSVPRASLAAVSGSARRPAVAATPSPFPSASRGPVTPSRASGAVEQAHPQLINTPATTRARRSAATSTARRGPGWRASLQGQDVQAAQKLAERQEVVRGVAEDVLEKLLQVGYDADTGEPTGTWTLSEETKKDYELFENVKTRYLSKDQFLDGAALAASHPLALASPSSPLNQLIRLCNTVTFLFLLFTSSPNIATGIAPRTATQQLKTASQALLRHVKPDNEPVDDTLLHLLAELQCQTFLTAASLSRTPLNATAYFKESLSSLLPASAGRYLTDRSATVKFQSLQSRALKTVEETGGDWQVLRTKWSWYETVQNARDYVEREVLSRGGEAADRLGAQSQAGESPAAQDVFSVDEQAVDAQASAGRGLDVDAGTANRALETSDDEVARRLGASSSPARPSHSSPSSPGSAADLEEVEQLSAADVEGEITNEGIESHTAELLSLIDEAEDGDEIDGEGGLQGAAEERETLPGAASGPAHGNVPVAAPTQLRIGPGNKLYLGAKKKQQRSLLDRQADAVKISFDSQSQSQQGSPPPATGQDARTSPQPAFEGAGGFDDDFGGGFDEENEGRSASAGLADVPAHAGPSASGRSGTDAAAGRPRVDKGKGRAFSREPSASASGLSRAQQWLLSASAPYTAQVPRSSTSKSRHPAPSPGPAGADGFDDPDEPTSDDSRRQETIRRQKRAREVERDSGFDGRAGLANDSEDDLDDVVPPHRADFVPSSNRRQPPARATSSPPPPPRRVKTDRRQTGERRPWEASEERFFIQCLKSHGCNWARIRDLHGKNGRVSTKLKYRDNVGLKDKARNMKAKYTRAGQPVPAYLQEATSYPNAVLPEEAGGVVMTDEED
ncbi:hypothetical protein JCM6882_001143 [Rhodosporidiobolus microsporus]